MEKNEITPETNSDKETVKRALKSMFPSPASFAAFREKDRNISPKAISAIIHYAFTHAVIHTESEKAFIDFLSTKDCPAFGRHLPDDCSFSDILAHMAGNSSVNTLITQMDKTSQSLGLPAVSASMFTRLRQNFKINTPKKRALLRLLAFWIGKNHPEMDWHYDSLLQIPEKSAGLVRQPQEKTGVTIGFHLQGQGEMILPADIHWLKKELADCLDYLKLRRQIHKKKIEMTGTTSFSLRFLKKPGSAEEPILYHQAIRNALAVAHQMSVRWLLCSHSSPRKRLIMMINAGLMREARRFDMQLPQNIPANDPGIYLSNFAHVCAETSNIQGFRRCPAESLHKSAAWSDMWSLLYFWPNHFYDYIPCLLDDKMLPKCNTGPEYEEFQHALLSPETSSRKIFGALEAIHRHPQHTLHFIEIAKVLHARQMPHAAEEVISRILLAEPENLPARYMRLLAYGHLANREADIDASLPAFERGISEGEHILKSFHPDPEILWAIGIQHFNRAIKLIYDLRHRRSLSAASARQEMILSGLATAADYFHKGLAASSSGQTDSCLFWLQYALSFLELFSGKEKNFFNREITLKDDQSIFRQAGIRTLRNLGLIPNVASAGTDRCATTGDIGLKAALFIFSKNQNAMLGRSYLPYTQCTLAMVLWDFTPELTMAVYKIIRHLLEEARRNALRLLPDNLCVYHVFSGFMPADRYITHVEQIIELVKSFISEDDLNKGDSHPISRTIAQKMTRTKLMLMEVDRL